MPDPEEFYRIKRLPPYVFAEVNRLKAECRARGMDIIDFGMGNPDMDTPTHIVDKLVETVRKPRTHRYSSSRGSKERLVNLAMAITAPGDVILAPNPSYPIHPYGFMIAGGALRHIAALGSMAFSKILLREAEVAVSPGIGFGEYGESFVRIGLVENVQRIRQAARGARRLMQRGDEILSQYSQLKEAGA